MSDLLFGDNIAEIAAALVAAQAEFREIQKDTVAGGAKYQYKYATLDQLMGMVRPVVAKHGLCVMQAVTCKENRTSVTTLLLHSSGQNMQTGPMVMDVEPSVGLSAAQSAGKNITYCRRYQLQSLLGIAAEEDVDAGLGPDASGKKSRLEQLRERHAKKAQAEPKPASDDFDL